MNQHEFMQLINPFTDRLYRLAKRLLISKDEASDAQQEVLLKLWQKKEDLNNYKNVEAFAVTMTKNYCLDQLKSKRAQRADIENVVVRDTTASVYQQVEDRDSWDHIEKYVSQLPETQRLLFQYREVEEMEYDIIAELTGMNETAIRVALSRLRKQIREFMILQHQ
ncbi:MAG: RNA polymerase subunit sigma-70 [Flavobacterium sp. BFFFF2]|nr:MAG: RNA polymerase subunit sigma-70 [Flavobacterium sp. BFFFF2]